MIALIYLYAMTISFHRHVRALFDMSREKSPYIVFIDEIDSMCSKRQDNEPEGTRRVKTEFLSQLDGKILYLLCI